MGPRARDWWILLAIWVPLTLVGELLLPSLIGLYPEPATSEGRVSDDAIFYLLRWTVPIAAAVFLMLIYLPLRFRDRGNEAGDAAFQMRRNNLLAVAWVVVMAGIVLGFVRFPGVSGLREIWSSQEAENPLEVEVVARQWEWSFSYPQYGVEEVSDLVLPIDRTVRFDITSEDVIHSFWIPSFRIKQDAVPGQTMVLYLTPTRITSSEEDPMTRVQCAELCGVGHARMRSAARVVSGADFRNWLEQQGGQSTESSADEGDTPAGDAR